MPRRCCWISLLDQAGPSSQSHSYSAFAATPFSRLRLVWWNEAEASAWGEETCMMFKRKFPVYAIEVLQSDWWKAEQMVIDFAFPIYLLTPGLFFSLCLLFVLLSFFTAHPILSPPEDLFLSFIRPWCLEELLEIRLLRVLLGRTSQFHLLYILIDRNLGTATRDSWNILRSTPTLWLTRILAYVCLMCAIRHLLFAFPLLSLDCRAHKCVLEWGILSLNMRYWSRELEPLLCVSWRLLDGLFKFFVQR